MQKSDKNRSGALISICTNNKQQSIELKRNREIVENQIYNGNRKYFVDVRKFNIKIFT